MDLSPVWSPDGKWIAYSHYQQAFRDTMVTGLYVLEVETGRRELVVEGSTVAPTWFGDSRRIAFAPAYGGAIFTTELGDGTPVPLVASAVVFSSVSPADTALAFESPEGEPWGPSSIWIKDLQSGVERDISVHGTGEWRQPRWSPDGRWILHYRYGPSGSGATELFKMDPTGSISIRLTQNDKHDIQPCWSPSGSTIAWTHDALDEPTIWIANADGSSARPLVRGLYPGFSPDGVWIVFVDPYSRDGKDLHRIRTDGTGYEAL